MGMTRQERIALHKKQERLQIKSGTPNKNDLKEGVPVLRSTSKGVVEYVKFKGVLHKQILDKDTRTLEEEINDTVNNITINDLTVTDPIGVDMGGTGHTTLSDGYVLLGNGTSSLNQLDVTTSGAIIIGDGTTAPTTYDAFSSSTGTLNVSAGGTGQTTVTDFKNVLDDETWTFANNVTATGRVIVDDTTEATSTTDGSLQTDGGLSVVKDAIFGNDVKLLTNASVFSMGVGSDFTITHDNTTGATLAGNPITITSGGAATWTTSAGNLTIDSAAAVLVLDGHTGATVTSSNSGAVEISSAANVDINATTGVTIDGTTVSIDGTDDSNLTVTASGKDLDIAVAGGSTQELRLASAGTGASAMHLNASAGGINIDSADMIDIDAADEITIDTTSADGHIAITSAHTAGQSILISSNADADSILDIDAGILDIDAAGAVAIDSSGGTINIGDDTVAAKISIGGDKTTRTEVELNAREIDINAGDLGFFITADRASEILTTAGNLEVDSVAGNAYFRGNTGVYVTADTGDITLTTTAADGDLIIGSPWFHAGNFDVMIGFVDPAAADQEGRLFGTGHSDQKVNYIWVGMWDIQASGEYDTDFGDW